jgi:hypothetical protein
MGGGGGFTDTQANGGHEDRISLIPFVQNKGSRLKSRMNYEERNEYSMCLKRYLIRGLVQYMIWGKGVVK